MGAVKLEVAGGGIAGLTAGLAFARMGWSVRVHEQDDALRIPGAGIYIWENGLRVLEALGVLDAVRAGAIAATMHEKRDHDGTLFASGGFAPDFRLIVPERRTLLTALADAVKGAGGELVFGSKPVAALPEGKLIFADGTSADADLVIGADGINSGSVANISNGRSKRGWPNYFIPPGNRTAALDTVHL